MDTITMDDKQDVTIDRYVREGMGAILQGQIKKALSLLDSAYYLFPKQRAQLWQRGIACYYGGRYEDGAAQFELDMEVNGCDVEEVLWHFLCNCKWLGFSGAKERGFLQLRGSVTIAPMKEVLEMFEGKRCSADVIQAATPMPGQHAIIESYNGTNALAYAHFYCGLYCDHVLNHIDAALTHFEKAAEFDNQDFISKLMKYHWEMYKLRVYHPSLMPRFKFSHQQNDLSFSAVIEGGWKLSTTYSASPNTPQSVVTALLEAIDCGITSMDCGDIYTGVEQIYGKVLKVHLNRGGKRSDVQIFTKFVPDLEAIRANKVDESYVRSVVNRSLGRLEITYLDLVQFHWWDCSLPQYVDVIHYLSKLQQEGIIRNIGLTNFNVAHCQKIISTGVKLASIQVQYSMIDKRPCSSGLVKYCIDQGIAILAYGVLAGGFLTDRWLHRPKPSQESLGDRGLIKYFLIIEEFGGWDLFQQLLVVLRQIADNHSPLIVSSQLNITKVTIAMVAIQYVLSRDGVKAVITTAHKPEYRQLLVGACHLKLNSEDIRAINNVLSMSNGVPGQVYELERCITGCHGSIMKYNLNQVNEALHLEELCERFVYLYFLAHPEEGTKMGYHFSISDQHLAEDLSKFDYFKYSVSIVRSLSCDAMVNMSHKEILYCISQMKALLYEVEGIKCEALNKDQLVDLRVIKSRIALELLVWEELQRHKKDLLHYLSVDGIMLLLPVWGDDKEEEKNVHPSLCDTGSVYRSLCLLSRLQALPSLLLHAEQSIHQPCQEVIETTIRTCEHLEIFLRKELPKYVSATIDTHLLDELLLTSRISAACVNKFCCYVKQSLLPTSVTGNVVGVEMYKKILQLEHFIEDVDELLTMGETHFAELKKELDCLASDISPGKSWQEVTRDVIRPHHPTAYQLLECYMSEIDKARLHVFTMDIIPPLPVDERVKGFYTPEILRPFSPFGDFLNPPPFGVSNTGLLMLHSVKSLELCSEEEEKLLQAHDYTWIRVIAAHECFPGHHVQMLCAQRNPRILRKFLLSVYFYEGWGLYTEELAYETGFYAREFPGDGSNVIFSAEQSAKLTRLTQLRLRLWRAARVVLDIKLNTGQMTFKECCQFLEHEVMFDPSSSCGEVFMYLSRPGYAPCYLAGYVEMMKLQDQVKKQLGSKFSLKAFHDSLLSKGCLPFKCLPALLDL